MFQVLQRGPSIGSGPQFYTKPPTALPINQTIEFDEGPKITVFVGKFSDFRPKLLDLEIFSLPREHQ